MRPFTAHLLKSQLECWQCRAMVQYLRKQQEVKILLYLCRNTVITLLTTLYYCYCYYLILCQSMALSMAAFWVWFPLWVTHKKMHALTTVNRFGLKHLLNGILFHSRNNQKHKHVSHQQSQQGVCFYNSHLNRCQALTHPTTMPPPLQYIEIGVCNPLNITVTRLSI